MGRASRVVSPLRQENQKGASFRLRVPISSYELSEDAIAQIITSEIPYWAIAASRIKVQSS